MSINTPHQNPGSEESPMHILYYLNQFPKISETFVLNEIRELQRLGHRVTVVSLKDAETDIIHDEFEELDIDIHYISYPSARDIVSLATYLPRLPAARFGDGARAITRRLAIRYLFLRTLQVVSSLDTTPDLIHSHFLDWPKHAAAAVSDLVSIPFTVTAHAFGLFRDINIDGTTSLLNQATAVVTISEYNQDYIEETFHTDTPVHVIHTGIRPDKFSGSVDAGEATTILSVCRFVEKKGIEYSLRAISELVDNHPEITYHLIGSGELETELRQLCSELEIEDNVMFLGSVSDERLLDELSSCGIFVLPCVIASDGDRDGIPVVLMEAMAMQRPVVTTNVSGITELVSDEVNGLVVPPRDAATLATAIDDLLADDERRREFGKMGREKVVESFDIRKQSRVLLDLFTSLVQQ
ncbi:MULTISPECIES: glycosyltransferase family 4 protein [Haloferax]|uniref:Glycosyltransferase n=1 Tax=Haloferax marinum TaxID=2666143 RepID=A0A6A8G367_9EURY|nr:MULTISPECIES: glycosyltransferase family 4 protein [Haloferax]KAB1196259.1 glycosyltransferase family 4 protein [Haloferax sp. CBA1150]MRW95247.1 glycosyltransferase [Haloferax marinum]